MQSDPSLQTSDSHKDVVIMNGSLGLNINTEFFNEVTRSFIKEQQRGF